MIYLKNKKTAQTVIFHRILFTCALLTIFVAWPVSAFKPTAEYGHYGIVRDAVTPITWKTSVGTTIKFSERAILEMRDSTGGVDEFFSSRGEITTPAAHCDDELLPECTLRMKTIRDNVIKILNSQKNGTRARAEVGRALHTLQDFYSHSNWVNISGNPLFDSKLGRGSEARLPLSTQTCIDNFWDGTLTGAGLTSLTSGHFSSLGLEPPNNKCTHGIAPGAGIHKDAPGRTSHVAARAAAVAGTRDFINQILNNIKGDDAALRAFMDVRPPVGFVIDDTGSMGPTIRGVQSAIASLVQSLEAADSAPDQYVLVTFGDPEVGSAFVTSDGSQIVNQVNNISPRGGGDCPEFAMAGLLTAINAIGPDGTLYLFTDASAKDGGSSRNVVAAANRKNVSVWVQQSGTCPDSTRVGYDQDDGSVGEQHTLAKAVKKGSYRANKVEKIGGHKTLVVTDPYSIVTQNTGGQHLLSENTEQAAEDFFKVVEPSASGSLEPVLLANGLLPAGTKTFSFPVDNTLDTLLVSVNFAVPGSVTLLRPAGSPVANADPDATITNLTSGQIINVANPAVGGWRLQVNSTEGTEYAVNISGKTDLALTRFAFVEERGRDAHTGLFPINGNPVAGQKQTILASVQGTYNTITFKTVSLDNTFIKNIPLTKGGDEVADDDFSGTYTPGSDPVRVLIRGQNGSAQTYQRVLQKSFSGQAVEVKVLQDLIATEVVSLKQFTAHFRVANHGPDSTFDFTSDNNIGAEMMITPPSAEIKSGTFVDVMLTADLNLVLEEFASISLLASSADSSNSAVLFRPVKPFQLPVFPKTGVFPEYLKVTDGATSGWSLDSSMSFEGPTSIKSDDIGDGEFASIEVVTNFSGGPFFFARKVSSENGFDFFNFYVDEELKQSWTGELDWELFVIDIPAGEHKLRWSYVKDGSVSKGEDAAWIDAMKINASGSGLLSSPTGITATDGMFSDRVRITFSTVAEATVYRVYRCLNAGETCGSPIGFPTTGTFDDTKGNPGTVYHYRVRACNATTCSSFSAANTGFFSTAPARPTGIMATDGTFSDRVRVTFNTVAGATVYRVFRCQTTGQTCGSPIGFPKSGTFDDLKGIPGTVYYYRVRACTASTCGKFSVANTGFSKVGLAKPTGVRASDGTYARRVRVTWNRVAEATVYRVFRCSDTGSNCGLPVGFPSHPVFDDINGVSGVRYYYRVRACTATGCSKFSSANAGHRGTIPSTNADTEKHGSAPSIEAVYRNGDVSIPVLSGQFGRWLLIMMILGIGLLLIRGGHKRFRKPTR